MIAKCGSTYQKKGFGASEDPKGIQSGTFDTYMSAQTPSGMS